jgi:hypothetical protein
MLSWALSQLKEKRWDKITGDIEKQYETQNNKSHRQSHYATVEASKATGRVFSNHFRV